MTIVFDATEQTSTATPRRRTAPRNVSVNGTVIPRAAIAREVQHHPAAKAAEAWQSAARALVVRELLLQEARRIGLVAEPEADDEGRRETDEEALVRGLVAREVRPPEPDEATCRRYFEANRSAFRSPDLYEARHILLAAAPGDAAARVAAGEQAGAIIAALQADPNAFAALASAHSMCPSAASGGNLGQIGPGQTVPEFEAALAELPVGAVSPAPVETRYGCHVVRVERRIAGRDLPFEIAHVTIASRLAAQARRTAIRRYIAALAAAAHVEGVDLPVQVHPQAP